ncbi:unnamed protein product [Arctogadus glacialis]
MEKGGYGQQMSLAFQTALNLNYALRGSSKEGVEDLHMGKREKRERERGKQVSIVKSEETKVRQEDLSKLLYEVQLLRTQQDNMECQMQDMKQ